MSAQVFIAGAGPTGLVLALWLRRRGVTVRMVDRLAAPATTSRAIAVQARTLELYRQAGLADAIIERGLKFTAANFWAGGHKVAHVPIGDLGAGLSPYPYLLSFPQDQHERLLIDRLRAAGVEIERGVELIGWRPDGARGVQVTLRRADGATESDTARYLAGCDGAHSAVRIASGIGFDGGTYAHLFYVADVEARGPIADGQLHVALDEADFLAAFPLKSENPNERAARVRLIGTVRSDATPGDGHPDGHLGWADVSHDLIRRLRVDVERVNWFSTYRVHHRVAQRFRAGPAFLLGDAAHVHSPVGGQGMNTGIGDAINLAWKLGDVLEGRAPESLLDSYQAERIGFARRLVATTDRMFTAAVSPGLFARRVRVDVIPRLFPAVARLRLVRRFLFRTVAQIGIAYRDSPISAGRAGGVHGGDRLPWVAPDDGAGDNHAPLDGLDWQVHVYGDSRPALTSACAALGLTLHSFPWRPAMRDAGLKQDAFYLIRPDGYVACAGRVADPDPLARYLRERGLRARAERGAGSGATPAGGG